jgi:hypothetical protein
MIGADDVGLFRFVETADQAWELLQAEFAHPAGATEPVAAAG